MSFCPLGKLFAASSGTRHFGRACSGAVYRGDGGAAARAAGAAGGDDSGGGSGSTRDATAAAGSIIDDGDDECDEDVAVVGANRVDLFATAFSYGN